VVASKCRFFSSYNQLEICINYMCSSDQEFATLKRDWPACPKKDTKLECGYHSPPEVKKMYRLRIWTEKILMHTTPNLPGKSKPCEFPGGYPFGMTPLMCIYIPK
jgi:hypothetical protein